MESCQSRRGAMPSCWMYGFRCRCRSGHPARSSLIEGSTRSSRTGFAIGLVDRCRGAIDAPPGTGTVQLGHYLRVFENTDKISHLSAAPAIIGRANFVVLDKV